MKLTLADVMTKSPVSIEHHASLQDAIQLMYSKGVNHLPVTKDGVLLGIISDRDTKLAKAVTPAAKAVSMTVGELCNQDPFTVSSTEPLSNVAKVMVERKIGSALVTSQGMLVGIFTVTDALRALITLQN
jgi:acetoin utilization protein AcuB